MRSQPERVRKNQTKPRRPSKKRTQKGTQGSRRRRTGKPGTPTAPTVTDERQRKTARGEKPPKIFGKDEVGSSNLPSSSKKP